MLKNGPQARFVRVLSSVKLKCYKPHCQIVFKIQKPKNVIVIILKFLKGYNFEPPKFVANPVLTKINIFIIATIIQL